MEIPFEDIVDRLSRIETALGNISTFSDTGFISIADASEFTGLSESSLRGFISSGSLPYYRPGRKILFRKTELLEWMERFKTARNENNEIGQYFKQ